MKGSAVDDQDEGEEEEPPARPPPPIKFYFGMNGDETGLQAGLPTFYAKSLSFDIFFHCKVA